jgi:hypothetical protein
VDLHTRKETDAWQGWKTLLEEVDTGLASGLCGFMIHHTRMNEPAFLFLEDLLDFISRCSHIRPVTFNDLI